MRKHVIELPPQAAIRIRIGGCPVGEAANSIRGRGGTIVPLLTVPLVTVPLKASSIRRHGDTIVVLRLVTMTVLMLMRYIVPLFSVPIPQPLELRSTPISAATAASTLPPDAAVILCPMLRQLHPAPRRVSRVAAAAAAQTNPEGAAILPTSASTTTAPVSTAIPTPAGRCSEVLSVVLERLLGRVPAGCGMVTHIIHTFSTHSEKGACGVHGKGREEDTFSMQYPYTRETEASACGG